MIEEVERNSAEPKTPVRKSTRKRIPNVVWTPKEDKKREKKVTFKEDTLRRRKALAMDKQPTKDKRPLTTAFAKMMSIERLHSMKALLKKLQSYIAKKEDPTKRLSLA